MLWVNFIHWLFNLNSTAKIKRWLVSLINKQASASEDRLKQRLKQEEEKMSELVDIPADWQEEVFALRQEFHKKFSRLVVWGLRGDFHSHRYIHRAYYFTAKRLGIPAVWLEDRPESNDQLLPGDFVMVMGDVYWVFLSHIKPLSDICYYLNSYYRHDFVAQLKKEQYLLWQEYKLSLLPIEQRPHMIRFSEDEGFYYDPKLRILHQHYGTDILPWEFWSPVYNPNQRQVNYVGSLWPGNEDIVQRFMKYLHSVGLKLHVVQRTTLAEQINLIRQSRLAPSISGKHAAKNYPPCRMYKNISYGQLGYANVPIHQELYKDCHPPVGSLEEMSDYVLGMSKDDYVSMILAQQKITQRFTILRMMMNMFKYF